MVDGRHASTDQNLNASYLLSTLKWHLLERISELAERITDSDEGAKENMRSERDF